MCLLCLFLASSTVAMAQTVANTENPRPVAPIATALPTDLFAWLQLLDPDVQVRSDGLIRFEKANKVYIPVLPETIVSVPQVGVKSQWPAKVAFPDYWELNSGVYLLRLVPTKSGKLMFPRLSMPPMGLLQGILPQQWAVPRNLLVPQNLKSILGDLVVKEPAESFLDPMEGLLTSTTAQDKPSGGSQVASANPEWNKPSLQPQTGAAHPLQLPTLYSKGVLYSASIDKKELVAVDPTSGAVLSSIALQCVPTSITPSYDQRQVFVTCLSSNELLVVDVAHQLIKKHITVGNKPISAAMSPDGTLLVVANRSGKSLSVVDVAQFEVLDTLELDVSPETITFSPNGQSVLVSAYGSDTLLEVNLLQRNTTQRTKGMEQLSGIAVSPDGTKLWLLSKAHNSLRQVELAKPEIGPSLEVSVGRRPVSLIATEDALLVLSSYDDRLDIINPKSWQIEKSVALRTGLFPTAMVLHPSGKWLYIIGAGENILTVVDLQQGAVVKELDWPVQGVAVALIGTPAMPSVPKVVAKSKVPKPKVVVKQIAPVAVKPVVVTVAKTKPPVAVAKPILVKTPVKVIAQPTQKPGVAVKPVKPVAPVAAKPLVAPKKPATVSAPLKATLPVGLGGQQKPHSPQAPVSGHTTVVKTVAKQAIPAAHPPSAKNPSKQAP